MNFTETVSVGDIIFEVEGDYEPGDLGVHTLSNGDPGYPPTDPEVEISSCIAYIPKSDDDDDDEQIAVDGNAILDFADKWEELEQELCKKLESGGSAFGADPEDFWD